MDRKKLRNMVLYALFTAMIFVLGLTPLGFINLPIASITTVHIPVIIAAFIFGAKGGALMGFMFGLTSLIRCFTTPDATAAIVLGTGTGFGLYNIMLILIVIFLPRILTGVVAALLFKLISRKDKSGIAAMGVSALAGTLTNTVFFLGGLYILAFEQTAAAFGVAGGALLGAILGVVAVNGVLEAVAAVIICVAVGKAILYYLNRNKISDDGGTE